MGPGFPEKRWGLSCWGPGTHILGSVTQHNIAAGPLLAKGGGDQGIFQEEDGPHVIKNEDVVLGGQEAAVAMGQHRGYTLAETAAAAPKCLEIQALRVCRREGEGGLRGRGGTREMKQSLGKLDFSMDGCLAPLLPQAWGKTSSKGHMESSEDI